ncbi:maleylacetoacetate isomerase [Maricaulis sp. D1M11]|uniref:maleylacetoacetate isomerase n=1 Tax=Maricaulis sp. D1M11 TaxID=3076117 RepID=UPI0039B5689C
MKTAPLTLYGYWRSSAAYRLRIALNLKGLDYEQVAVNLKAGEQTTEAWLAQQPQGLVPVLKHGSQALVQSPAIVEWIEETWPEPALLPSAPADRAIVRGWAAVIGCDIHPLQNLRVLKAAAALDGQGMDSMKAWAQRWMVPGLRALNDMVRTAKRPGDFLWGEHPGLAEVYLVPQLYNARRWGVDVEEFPTLLAADIAARALPAFIDAAPENQPDAEAG